MGFIDYHGTKENRYTEVLEYAHAQQEEDWKKKEELKVKKWLGEQTGSSRLAELTIQDLLKRIIVGYQGLQAEWSEVCENAIQFGEVDTDRLWKDITIDLAERHIQPFHMPKDQWNKFLDSFLNRIFKASVDMDAESYYKTVSERQEYRRYFTECFDPAWKGQQVFRYLQEISRKDKNRVERVGKYIDQYADISILIGLYLHMAIQPRDDGWMIQLQEERRALVELKGKIKRKALPKPDYGLLMNPLYVVQKQPEVKPEPPERETETDEPEEIRQQGGSDEGSGERSDIFEPVELPSSKLRKEEFSRCVEQGGIPNYVAACRLLLECEMPSEIEENYQQLIKRMPVLQDAIGKFDDIYHADMDVFEEYYAPEALKLTATFLDYQAVAPSEKVLQNTREGVILSTRKLLQVVNEKIDEIYKFVTIETNAQAKALEAIMSQDGYVDQAYKIK